MAVKFKINVNTSAHAAIKAAQEAEIERAKEYSKKYPEKYLPIIDAVEIPLPKRGNMESKLKIVVQRDGNDDIEDIENPLMLDVRLYIKRPDDEAFIATKKGIHIPYGEEGYFMRFFANTLLEVHEDIEAKRAAGEKF